MICFKIDLLGITAGVENAVVAAFAGGVVDVGARLLATTRYNVNICEGCLAHQIKSLLCHCV